MTEPQDVLAEALADVMEPPGWQVLGSTMPIRAQAAYHHAAAAILASLDGRGYALVRTPETLDARGMGAIEAAWFALARDFTYTGPHDRETAHDIVVQHRPAIEAALRLAASPAPDPGAGLREAAQKVIDSCEYVDGTAQQMADDRALDRLRAALAASPAPDPGAGLRELSDAATPGPWVRQTVGNASVEQLGHKLLHDLLVPLPDDIPPHTDATYLLTADGSKNVAFIGNGPRQTENGDFIVAAVNYVRAALSPSAEPPETET